MRGGDGVRRFFAEFFFFARFFTCFHGNSCSCGTGHAHMAPSSPETTPYFSILSPPLDPLLMSIRSAPSSWATPSRTSRPRRARGCRGGLGGALGERPRSAVLLLLLSSVSGAPVSGSDSAARQEAIDSLVARSSLVELQISGSRTGLVYRVGVEGCLPLRQSGPPRTLYLVACLSAILSCRPASSSTLRSAGSNSLGLLR